MIRRVFFCENLRICSSLLQEKTLTAWVSTPGYASGSTQTELEQTKSQPEMQDSSEVSQINQDLQGYQQSVEQQSSQIHETQQQQQDSQTIGQNMKPNKVFQKGARGRPPSTIQYQNRGQQTIEKTIDNRKDNRLSVLRIEQVPLYALRQDIQELFAAYGVEIGDDNLVPEYTNISFKVQRWWALLKQTDREKLLEAQKFFGFRLAERRIQLIPSYRHEFNQATFNTLGLGQSMGRYAIVHNIPASAHEADVLRLFKDFQIAPNGIQVMQLDHYTRSTDHKVQGKKAVVKFENAIEANRAARVSHGKVVSGKYKLQLQILP